jgi:hypothetical protein
MALDKLDEREREIRMMGAVWLFLQQETGIAERPGKLADYASSTDFDVDCHVRETGIRAEVNARTKLDS